MGPTPALAHARSGTFLNRRTYLLLASAGLLYVFYAHAYYVGYFIDDAAYINGARSLLHGRYVELATPDHGPIQYFLPGFPLFLTPFVALVAPHWALLKWVSIVLTLATGLLLMRLAEPWLNSAFLWALSATYLFNRTIAFASPWVMSDMFFTFLALAIFLVLRRLDESSSPYFSECFLGALLGWIVIVRPMGLILVLAVGISLIRFCQIGAALRILAFPSIMSGAVLLFKSHTGQFSSGYWPLWRQSFAFLADRPAMFLDNFNRVTNLFFVMAAWGIRLPYSPLGLSVNLAIAMILGAIAWQGYNHLKNLSPKDHAVSTAIVLFLAGYYSVHVFWPAIAGRYALPVLPFFLTFIFAGVYRLSQQTPWRFVLRPGAALLVLLVVLSNIQNFRQIKDRSRLPSYLFPEVTLSWIRKNIPEKARLLSARISFLYLYTGRHGIALLQYEPTKDRESFRYQVLRQGITHVLSEPLEVLYRPRSAQQPLDQIRQYERWAASSPEAFPVVFRDTAEGETIFQVAPDPVFVKAYDHYLAARSDLDRSDLKSGLRELDAALALKPDFVKALNAYGAALLLGGHKLNTGEAKLKRALLHDPQCVPALLNLVRLYRTQNNRVQALGMLHRALGVIRETAEYQDLAPALIYESRQLAISSSPNR